MATDPKDAEVQRLRHADWTRGRIPARRALGRRWAADSPLGD